MGGVIVSMKIITPIVMRCFSTLRQLLGDEDYTVTIVIRERNKELGCGVLFASTDQKEIVVGALNSLEPDDMSVVGEDEAKGMIQ